MPRNRIISPAMALLVSSGNATGANQNANLFRINRLTQLDYSWDNPKENIQIYGKTASLLRETTQPPTVNLSFSYYVLGVANESNLGFTMNSNVSALADIIGKLKDEKNYYIYIAPEGADADGRSGADPCNVIGVGNGYISSYSLEGAVGGFPTASVQVQGLNLRSYASGNVIPVPAVDPVAGTSLGGAGFTTTIPSLTAAAGSGVAVIRPGDITINLSNTSGVFHNLPDACVQSFNISYDLNLQNQQCLGSRFYRSRDIEFPVDVNLQVEFLATDIIAGNLADFICATGKYNVDISMKLPSCAANAPTGMFVSLRGLSLESQNWSTTAGSAPQTLSVTWLGQIGASGDNANGIFMTGITNL